MNNIFQLVETGVKFSFNPEDMMSGFDVIKDGPNLPKNISFVKFSENFNLYTLNNMHIDFPKETEEMLCFIEELRKKLTDFSEKSRIIENMLSIDIQPSMIRILKLKSFTSFPLHFDARRLFAINIGLKNSSSHETTIYDVADFPQSNPVPEIHIKNKDSHSFIMNDGDVYLFDVRLPHCATPRDSKFNPNGEDRYILSYDVF